MHLTTATIVEMIKFSFFDVYPWYIRRKILSCNVYLKAVGMITFLSFSTADSVSHIC